MKTEALFLFLILSLGLVLSSFLGGRYGTEGYKNHHGCDNEKTHHHHHNKHGHGSGEHHYSRHHYDNYNHYSGTSSSITNGTMFYGPNGETASINTSSNGMQNIKLMQSGGSPPIMFTEINSQSNAFHGPSGFSANILKSNNTTTIEFTFPDGSRNNFTQMMPNTVTSSEYFGSTGTSVQKYPHTGAYQNDSSSSYPSTSYSGPYMMPSMGNNNSSMMPSTMMPSSMMQTTSNGNSNNKYDSSLPPGIPASQIPYGKEDLYILKSEVVPPVCPVCPASTASCPRKEKCPPCPACARCPEPSFDCKKVPNYDSMNEDFLPQPVVNDFSQFGM
jgi:hypothetical protein